MIRFLVFLSTILVVIAKDPFGEIINGDLANIKDHPYFAYLAYSTSISLKCGGAIIKTNIIVTAAHCLNNQNFKVYTGIGHEIDLLRGKSYDIEKCVKFPKYQGQVVFDIGLVILKNHIELSPKVQIIEIAKKAPPIGARLTVVGFGKKDCDKQRWEEKYNAYVCASPHSVQFRSGKIDVIAITYGKLYTKGENQNTCYGDSGGPVVYEGMLVGLVSSGENLDCTGYDTQVFVPRYVHWIRKYMKTY